jgi:nicotinamide-nucleotide amidase
VLTVALVSTGHEVLRGHTLNTNASWLARRATEVGARVTSVRTVGDDLPDLEAAVRGATREARCVLVTGGLGPTEDDRSREALARVLGVPLLDDERAWAIVKRYFERSAREPSPMQRRQAFVPRGAEPLDNTEGTAPGLLARVGEGTVFLLPGPPREMRAMFEREVLPRWRAAGPASSSECLDETASRVIWTAGAPESEIATAIEDLMRAPEPVIGTHPDEGEVAVRLLARGPGAAARADAAVDEIVARLGGHVVSTDEDARVQHAVVANLKARGLVVTTAESITGGLVARMLVEVPGASDVFRGGSSSTATPGSATCSASPPTFSRRTARSPSPWPARWPRARVAAPAPTSRSRRPVSRAPVPTHTVCPKAPSMWRSQPPPRRRTSPSASPFPV